MTITVDKIIGLTTANFKVQLNGRIMLIPVNFIQAVYGTKLTFHNKKDAMTILKMA